jgi:putative ATP-binding cassette transporter
MSINVRAACSAHFLFFTLIGTVVFWLNPVLQLSRDALSGYALVLLYMMLPLEAMLGAIPGMGRAQVALERIHQGSKELLGCVPLAAPEPLRGPVEVARGFQSLRFQRATWSYRDRRDAGFTLGPLDFELRAGEVVFLVGSNGGGKSTLVKLLVGLYAPHDGEVFLNGERVASTMDDRYRELFSAVFSDFFLFDRLLGIECRGPAGDNDLDVRASHLLERLCLSHLVRVAEGKLSTTELSTGQRKRLALMVARLEDRAIYVFDEWAADQDPQYKELFYRHILPELKAAGKAVLVITHDDRYFELADRRIELSFGTLVERRAPPASSIAAAPLGT